MSDATNGKAAPALADALRVWVKIGLLSFGGPAGQIALMHGIVVDEKKWISEPRFLHALNFCMLLPGPEAMQLATYIGWLMHGWRGGIAAGALFIIPGFFVILALALAYALFQDTAFIPVLFFGLKAAVLAIVVQALMKIASRALKIPLSWLLAGAAFIAIYVFAVPFPLIVLAAALTGFLFADLFPKKGGGEAELDSPVQPTIARSLRLIVLFGALWVAPVLLAGLALGFDSVFVPLSAFMSKMAVVTFGGAYAVLAYVAQQAVETYHWLNPGEMLDGLALAETTPGPLVLVLTFVGSLAGFRDAGVLSPVGGAVLGAFLTTWVTFMPCFLWIFLGAPYMERLRANQRLSAALSAITAAVVGVVLNLAVWFAVHALFARVGTLDAGPVRMSWPEIPSLDPVMLALSALAFVLVFALKRGMAVTLAVCGMAGVLLQVLL
ncbi:MAG: chromate efflux transporter [Tepidamorphaceae bacterium]|nr:chromate efflux transporter [Rhodobiaceae bacterium]MCC0047661.1 chromate efflux transporter [Rhodobiaceae bacterium]